MKQELKNAIEQVIADKINYLEHLIDDLRASNTETKSSMGDKYETSREMLQQEITRIQNQLNEVLMQQESFLKIGVKESHIIVDGSYIETSMGNFVIACSLGEIKFENQKIFVLSKQTPLGQLLIGKKIGDVIEMNGKSIIINGVN
ncbi:hypothetical protein [Faecalibacter sp. LW9]|uniref:hypothetical protein n=1 Tax=Faecalibacter sp. LW9 TaxID=3103144 RepID=UPI002AFDD53E|nr:hypothetical protein [Faecalibacter sp. LW9]